MNPQLAVLIAWHYSTGAIAADATPIGAGVLSVFSNT
jgi:hypothetical protein